MTRLTTKLLPNGQDFAANAARMSALVQEFAARQAGNAGTARGEPGDSARVT